MSIETDSFNPHPAKDLDDRLAEQRRENWLGLARLEEQRNRRIESAVAEEQPGQSGGAPTEDVYPVQPPEEASHSLIIYIICQSTVETSIKHMYTPIQPM